MRVCVKRKYTDYREAGKRRLKAREPKRDDKGTVPMLNGRLRKKSLDPWKNNKTPRTVEQTQRASDQLDHEKDDRTWLARII